MVVYAGILHDEIYLIPTIKCDLDYDDDGQLYGFVFQFLFLYVALLFKRDS